MQKVKMDSAICISIKRIFSSIIKLISCMSELYPSLEFEILIIKVRKFLYISSKSSFKFEQL